MSAVHQAMMSRYGDREHPMPVLLDQLSGGDAGGRITCTERGSMEPGRNGLSLAGLIPYLCKGR